ncbi:unnamed protein product [Gongylonema pulchrum]|uniref:Uncharacterized protein n=1 Tax=Gongylonema pulchrum TaxID=637853 RepID=A0A183EA40_9BILA|nr:unnamed protein product [Gongylonema pulchrum]
MPGPAAAAAAALSGHLPLNFGNSPLSGAMLAASQPVPPHAITAATLPAILTQRSRQQQPQLQQQQQHQQQQQQLQGQQQREAQESQEQSPVGTRTRRKATTKIWKPYDIKS